MVEFVGALTYRAGMPERSGKCTNSGRQVAAGRAVALLVPEKLMNYDHERLTFPIPFLHGRLRGLPSFGTG